MSEVNMNSRALPIIPEFITVHIGTPGDGGENVTVSFPDYIKNVASSEIYPSWPEAALVANIIAQVSFALNRVYIEYYRSRGYDFDITNNTYLDQSFIPGRSIFESISEAVDRRFNTYIRREGAIEPLSAKYCDGELSMCDGLSQNGSLYLANQGYSAFEILQYYYGNDIGLVENAPIEKISESYPGVELSLGSLGNDVRYIQIRLNRISVNYPNIPKIPVPDGIFTEDTDKAVREFQRQFNLSVDGIVGKATWYRIIYVYNAVKRLSELVSEGITQDEIEPIYADRLQLGDEGYGVRALSVVLALIGEYIETVRIVDVGDVFDENIKNAVEDFQRTYGLPITGEVDVVTWENLFDVYNGIIKTIPFEQYQTVVPFRGNFLRLGSVGEDVYLIQTYLDGLSDVYPEIERVDISGTFDEKTDRAVKDAQRLFGLPENGVVGPAGWNAVASEYSDIIMGNMRAEGEE